jgi:hypothetical protein
MIFVIYLRGPGGKIQPDELPKSKDLVSALQLPSVPGGKHIYKIMLD